MTTPITPPSNTQFLLHIPAPPSFDGDDMPTINHVVLTVDTPRAQLTMQLPVGPCHSSLPLASWDRWIIRLHTSFISKFDTSDFDRDILVNIVCLYRAFTLGPPDMRVNSDFYIAFTLGFLELARRGMGRCVKHDLALYIADMRFLVPYPVLDEAPTSFFEHLCPEASPHLPHDHDAMSDATSRSAPSPSISAAAELPDVSADDSGYESFDSMPSLRTVNDSSDDYDSDSSEDPDSDEEEEALIRQGFVVDESETEISDLDI